MAATNSKSLGYYVKKVVEKFLYRNVQVVFFYRDGVPFEPGEGWELVQPSYDELMALDNEYTQARAADLKGRYDRGEVCHLIRLNGEVAHITWSAYRDRLLAEYELGSDYPIEMGRDVAFFLDSWTPENMRGKGSYTKTLLGVMSDPDETYWAGCLVSNYPSFRGLLKMGFIPRYLVDRDCYFGKINRYKTTDVGPNDYDHFLK